MRVFLAVGERGSLAAASRRLEISPAAVTRAIATLEKRFGVSLLQRTTRKVSLTDAGRTYFADCRDILARIEEAREAVTGVNLQPKGNLSVTAPVLYGKAFVTATIIRFLKAYPDVNVSAFFMDRVINLVEENIDVAIRIGQLPDSTLKAIFVGHVRKLLCASPDYLKTHGVPQHPQDLLQHTVIAASGVLPWTDWRFRGRDNHTTLRIKPRLTVTGNDIAIEAAKAGIGIAQLYSYQVADALSTGRLRPILEAYEEEPRPVHILHRETKFGAAKARMLIDMLTKDLRGHHSTQDRPA